MIPIKDASLIARCEDSAIRREWRSRLVDHDGEGADDGGIARWLRLTDGLGLDRDYVMSLRGLVAGDALCRRCLCPLRAREDAARSHRLVADRIVLAADHQRAGRGDAGELSVRHPRDARLFRQAAAAGRARLRLRARLLQDAMPARPSSSSRCWPRSNSNAACCGRCATRCSTPTSIPKKYRPARLHRAADVRVRDCRALVFAPRLRPAGRSATTASLRSS